ncbi:hypothetical protein Salat_1850400 [Sesamum alatum]|uniref:Uncharacterized protein n=1 Tax=Sesamum alatum TaxID=300844 RepID=A0AAE1Y2W1_9LAMI|nr:hypothetical protein Salat_1850400 [Sesamum alatum]
MIDKAGKKEAIRGIQQMSTSPPSGCPSNTTLPVSKGPRKTNLPMTQSDAGSRERAIRRRMNEERLRGKSQGLELMPRINLGEDLVLIQKGDTTDTARSPRIRKDPEKTKQKISYEGLPKKEGYEGSFGRRPRINP